MLTVGHQEHRAGWPWSTTCSMSFLSTGGFLGQNNRRRVKNYGKPVATFSSLESRVVHCTDSKTHWGDVMVILGWMNKTDLILTGDKRKAGPRELFFIVRQPPLRRECFTDEVTSTSFFILTSRQTGYKKKNVFFLDILMQNCYIYL